MRNSTNRSLISTSHAHHRNGAQRRLKSNRLSKLQCTKAVEPDATEKVSATVYRKQHQIP